MLSVVRLVSFWRCIPVQYNCQKSSNFQGLAHFSRIFGKNDKIPGFFQAGKTVTIFPGFPGAVEPCAWKKSLVFEQENNHKSLKTGHSDLILFVLIHKCVQYEVSMTMLAG